MHVLAKKKGAQHGQQGQSAQQGAEQGERHGVGHRLEEPSRRTAQHIDGQVTGDDDRDCEEDRPLDVVRRVANDIHQTVIFAGPRSPFAEDVFHHHDGAIDDDSEIDGADGKQVGGNVTPVQADKREHQSERDGHSDNQRRPQTEQEQPENDEHQHQAQQEVLLHRSGGFFDQSLAVVIRNHFHVGRQDPFVQFFRHLLDALEDHLRLLANAHQNHAFHGLILVHVAKLAEPRRVADLHVGQIFHVDRDAAFLGYDDVADILQLAHQAEAANVVKLPALRIETTARVGVVVGELL